LGRFREAIAVYSIGIDGHPEDSRLYRHRGHRFISIRLFERAVELMAGALWGWSPPATASPTGTATTA